MATGRRTCTRMRRGVSIMKTLANNMAYLIKCKHQSGVDMP